MEEIKQQHEAATVEIGPEARTIIEALKASNESEPLASALIFLIEHRERDSCRITAIESTLIYYGSVLEWHDGEVQGAKAAQQEWGFSNPKEQFGRVWDAIGASRMACWILGIISSVALALHFVRHKE